MDIEVALEDVFHARTKRVVIGVLRRRADGGIFERCRQAVLVPLSGDRAEYKFRGVGDDAPPALLGIPHASAACARGDVVVRVNVKPHPVFSVDTVLSPLDLHATLPVSLLQHYYGADLELQHPSGEKNAVLKATYQPPNPSQTRTDNYRQVRAFQGLGLPDANGERGSLYAFLQVHLPIIDPAALSQKNIQEAITTLSSSNTGMPY
jgi:DnaJ-class molecular chaperone